MKFKNGLRETNWIYLIFYLISKTKFLLYNITNFYNITRGVKRSSRSAQAILSIETVVQTALLQFCINCYVAISSWKGYLFSYRKLINTNKTKSENKKNWNQILSYLSIDSTTTGNRIPKFNLSFKFFKNTYVFIFAWNLIPIKSPCKT